MINTGLIKTSTAQSLVERVQRIYQSIKGVIDSHSPTHIALEEGYCGVDGRSALKLGMVRGAIITAAIGTPMKTYSPSTVKMQALGAGYGNASKAVLLAGMHSQFPGALPSQQDIVDAVAVAVCGIKSELVNKIPAIL